MEWALQRRATAPDWMFGELTTGATLRCYTLEDELRKIKVDGETAIPAGRYEVIFERSPKFGPDTLTLLGVTGFKYIRIHSGETDDHTEGCILVGNRIDEAAGRISGGKLAKVLERLKDVYRRARAAGERVWITIYNAPDDHYVDTGEPAEGALA
jgi:hypothetical protein